MNEGITPDLAAYLLDLAQLEAARLSREYTHHKGMCGPSDPVVGKYVVQIHINNRALQALHEIVKGKA